MLQSKLNKYRHHYHYVDEHFEALVVNDPVALNCNPSKPILVRRFDHLELQSQAESLFVLIVTALVVFNAKTPNVPKIAVTVQNMFNQYKQAMGIEPQLMSGKASNTPSIKTFRSNAEVVAAMRDPRYKKDIAYQHEVQRRLNESDVFGIKE